MVRLKATMIQQSLHFEEKQAELAARVKRAEQSEFALSQDLQSEQSEWQRQLSQHSALQAESQSKIAALEGTISDQACAI